MRLNTSILSLFFHLFLSDSDFHPYSLSINKLKLSLHPFQLTLVRIGFLQPISLSQLKDSDLSRYYWFIKIFYSNSFSPTRRLLWCKLHEYISCCVNKPLWQPYFWDELTIKVTMAMPKCYWTSENESFLAAFSVPSHALVQILLKMRSMTRSSHRAHKIFRLYYKARKNRTLKTTTDPL